MKHIRTTVEQPTHSSDRKCTLHAVRVAAHSVLGAEGHSFLILHLISLATRTRPGAGGPVDALSSPTEKQFDRFYLSRFVVCSFVHRPRMLPPARASQGWGLVTVVVLALYGLAQNAARNVFYTQKDRMQAELHCASLHPLPPSLPAFPPRLPQLWVQPAYAVPRAVLGHVLRCCFPSPWSLPGQRPRTLTTHKDSQPCHH